MYKKSLVKLFLFFVLGILWAGCVNPLQSLEAKEEHPSTPLIYYAEGKYVACISKSIFVAATEYYNNGDMDAIGELIKTGRAIILKHGTEVYLLEVNSGIIKIRVKGTIVELWTYREEIYF